MSDVERIRTHALLMRAKAWGAAVNGQGGEASMLNEGAEVFDRAADALALVESAQGAEPLVVRQGHDDANPTWVQAETTIAVQPTLAAELRRRLIATAIVMEVSDG